MGCSAEVGAPAKGDAKTASRRSLRRADQLAIAMLGHPLRAGEMRVMNLAASRRFACGIEAKENLDGFAPIRAVARGIEQAQIENHMLAVWLIGGASRNGGIADSIRRLYSLVKDSLTLLPGFTVAKGDGRSPATCLEDR